MRYFFISFSHYKNIADGYGSSTIFGDGNMVTVTEGTFPNQEALLKDIQEKNPEIENITILNILELSEQDYKDFIGE